jgi:predicted O-methyltransferase YrrM
LRNFLLPESSELPKEFIRLCPWEIEYLFTVATHAKIGIVETGRAHGGSCFVMACAAPDTPIYSIDIAPRNDALLQQLFQRTQVGKNVELIVGDSQNVKYPHIGPIDLLFIDGDHSYQGCMNDLVNWYDHVVVGGHLVLHDSYLGSSGVQKAVCEFLQQHSELQVIQSPFISPLYWHYPAGSIAHFVKRSTAQTQSAASPRHV